MRSVLDDERFIFVTASDSLRQSIFRVRWSDEKDGAPTRVPQRVGWGQKGSAMSRLTLTPFSCGDCRIANLGETIRGVVHSCNAKGIQANEMLQILQWS